MLRKRKEPKIKKSIAEALLRDMQDTASEKLTLFEKLKARGGFDGEDRRELLRSSGCCGRLRRLRSGVDESFQRSLALGLVAPYTSTCRSLRAPLPEVGMESNHGVRDRASLSWWDEGSV